MITCSYCLKYNMSKDHFCIIKNDYVTKRTKICAAFQRRNDFFCIKSGCWLDYVVCTNRKEVRKFHKCHGCKQYITIKEILG
jgi:hypothetical protein